ncbi:MAG: hypothetical protein AAGK14_15160 [Verrucomicrobiota bacterium]
MTLSHWILLLALGCAAFGFFQFPSPLMRKLGLLVMVATTSLAAALLSGQWWAGLLVAAVWLFWPLSELVLVIRRFRLPRHRHLEDAGPPPGTVFEQLRAFSMDLNDAGFQQVDQCELIPGDHEQFYRLFRHGEGRLLASLSMIMQNGLGFEFITFYSRDLDGRTWITTNYPLPMPLKMPPEIALHLTRTTETPEEVLAVHREFLELNGKQDALAALGDEPRELRDLLEQVLEAQVRYNLDQGILRRETAEAQEDVCFTWRGTVHAAGLYLRELFRLG